MQACLYKKHSFGRVCFSEISLLTCLFQCDLFTFSIEKLLGAQKLKLKEDWTSLPLEVKCTYEQN